MEQTIISELPPRVKAEVEKFVERLVDERTQRENTAVLQRIETLTLELSRQNQELSHQNQELRHQRELMKQGFEMTDKRFDAVDKRFEDMNKRFEDMNKRFNSMQWMMGIGFTAIAILMALFKFLDASQGG